MNTKGFAPFGLICSTIFVVCVCAQTNEEDLTAVVVAKKVLRCLFESERKRYDNNNNATATTSVVCASFQNFILKSWESGTWWNTSHIKIHNSGGTINTSHVSKRSKGNKERQVSSLTKKREWLQGFAACLTQNPLSLLLHDDRVMTRTGRNSRFVAEHDEQRDPSKGSRNNGNRVYATTAFVFVQNHLRTTNFIYNGITHEQISLHILLSYTCSAL